MSNYTKKPNPTRPAPNPAASARRWFHLDREFRDEIKFLLVEAKPRQLALLDSDGALFGLADANFCLVFEAWLSATPGAQLRLATFSDSSLLAGSAPFQRLLRQKNSQIEWRSVPQESQRLIQQACALSSEGMVKKPVRAAFHGFADSDPNAIQGQLDYFDQVWQICEAAPTGHPLGL